MKHTHQLTVFFLLIFVFIGLTLVTLLCFPMEMLAPGAQAMPEFTGASRIQGSIIYSLVVLALYSLLGLAGYGLARKLGLPGIFRPQTGWAELFTRPLLIGAVCGLLLVLGDQAFVRFGQLPQGFSHPQFPLSIIASATAGIGEEILTRMFVFGIWAYLLNLALRRWNRRTLALWIANGIAALAFAASHLPSVMLITGATSLAEIPTLVLVEVFLLNGLIGMVAGWQYMRNGLVAASGVHFWADIVWHVIWPVLA